MLAELTVFWVAEIGLLALTAAIAGLGGYAKGYRAGANAQYQEWVKSRPAFAEPTPEALTAQYEAWKASEQRTRLHP